jgi:hypothetical protein
MPGNKRFGSDHRFAIEDLLDLYLERFNPGNATVLASERQETEKAAAGPVTVPEEDDQRRAAGAAG